MSVSYLSINGINKVFEQWATADPNISGYGFGQLYNQNGEPKASQRYPATFINPVRTDVNNLNYSVNRTFQILIYDILNGDRSNENSVVSDMEEIGFRLCRFLRNKSDVFNIVGTPTITPFSDKFLDDVSGVILDVVIEFNGESSDCQDPTYDFPIKYNEI